jgi:hypothetical protein
MVISRYYRLISLSKNTNRNDIIKILLQVINHSGCEIVSLLASSAVDLGFDRRLVQTKDYKTNTSMYCTHALLRSKNKDWLAGNEEQMEKGEERYAYLWIVVSVNLPYKIPTQSVGQVQNIYHHHFMQK